MDGAETRMFDSSWCQEQVNWHFGIFQTSSRHWAMPYFLMIYYLEKNLNNISQKYSNIVLFVSTQAQSTYLDRFRPYIISYSPIRPKIGHFE